MTRCIVYTGIGAKGPQLSELCPLVCFQKIKCILLNNFYVCSPTSMKLVSHLVKVRKKLWQNGDLEVVSLDMFSNFAILENCRNRYLRNYES